MYDLPYFKEHDPKKILQFVKEHPFAFLCGCDAVNKPVATQIPVFIDEREGQLFLSGHMMKNTDHHKTFLYNPDILAVFTGANSYVSASWYEDKQVASTWNYMSVHVKGRLLFLDEQALLNVLKRTTNHFENDPNSAANFEHIPTEYVERLAKAIVAFEVAVTDINHVFKLSQNHQEKNYGSIIEKLKTQGHAGEVIAAEMQQRASQLFNTK